MLPSNRFATNRMQPTTGCSSASIDNRRNPYFAGFPATKHHGRNDSVSQLSPSKFAERRYLEVWIWRIPLKKTFQMWYRNIEIISKQSSNVLIVLFAIHFFKIWQSLSRTTRFKRSDHRWHRQHNDRWNDEYVFRFSHTNW